MNHPKTSKNSILAVIVTASLIGLSARLSQADETCVNNPNGPKICVSFDGDAPELLFDFTVDYDTDPSNPSVKLRTGSTSWNVRSEGPEGSIGNIGAISIDPTVSTADFEVTIQTGTDFGANNVGSIQLSASGWSGYSSVVGGKIFGDLTNSLTVVQDSSNEGGEVTFEINGDVSGDATIPKVLSFTVGGDVSGDLNVEAIQAGGVLRIQGNVSSGSQVDVDELEDIAGNKTAQFIVEGGFSGDATIGRIGDGADFTIEGDLSGDVTMSGDLDRGTVRVTGDVQASATMTFQNIINYAHVIFAGDEVAGTVIFQEGVPQNGNQVQIFAEVVSGGTVDLTNDDVAGYLILRAGGAGSVINGGAVTSTGGVELGNGSGVVFSGTATFSGVDAGGELTFTIDGDVTSTAAISVPVLRELTINGDIAGDLSIDLIEGGLLEHVGAVESTAKISIKDLSGSGGSASVAEFCTGMSGAFARDLYLPGGVAVEQQDRIWGVLASSTCVDLHDTAAGDLVPRTDPASGRGYQVT